MQVVNYILSRWFNFTLTQNTHRQLKFCCRLVYVFLHIILFTIFYSVFFSSFYCFCHVFPFSFYRFCIWNDQSTYFDSWWQLICCRSLVALKLFELSCKIRLVNMNKNKFVKKKEGKLNISYVHLREYKKPM